MERGYLLVKMIKLPMHFTGRLLQSTMLCTIVFGRLLIRILLDTMYRVEHHI